MSIVLQQESINSSLLNLLTYPWIEKRVSEGSLNLHGGYYNFIDCTFEKWTLVYRKGLAGGSKYAIKNRSTWSWTTIVLFTWVISLCPLWFSMVLLCHCVVHCHYTLLHCGIDVLQQRVPVSSNCYSAVGINHWHARYHYYCTCLSWLNLFVYL